MRKLLIGVALLLLLLSVPFAHAGDNYYHLDVDWNRYKIIEMCDDFYGEYTGMRYFCIMSNFYALNKINDYYYEYREDTEAITVLQDTVMANYLDEYECVNYVAVDREFNRYLESR